MAKYVNDVCNFVDTGSVIHILNAIIMRPQQLTGHVLVVLVSTIMVTRNKAYPTCSGGTHSARIIGAVLLPLAAKHG